MRSRRSSLIILGLYCVLTLILAWPLVSRISTHLAGNDIDVWLNPWANWWTRKALVQGLDFYHTDYLFYPQGTSLYFHSFSHFNTGLWMLLEPVVGAIVAQNVTTLLSYVLSAFGTYLLVLYLTNDRLAASVSGFVFAFSPWHIEQSSHPVINTTQWLPLFMLCLIRLLSERRWRWAIGAAVFAWLGALSSWHLFLFSLLLGGLYLLATFLTDASVRTWEGVRLLGVCVLVALLLTAPLIFPLIREYVVGQDYVATSGRGRTADLLGIVTPSHHHPVIGRFMPPGYGRHSPRMSVFVGWTVLALTVYAGLRLWRRVYVWLLAAIVFLVVSWGPYLQVGGRVHQAIHFPWGDVIGRFFRAPDRFFVLVSLTTAVLAGQGLAHLVSAAHGSRWRRVGIGVLVGLIFFEFLYYPFPTLQPTVPAFYEQIADEAGQFALIDLPLGRRRQYMYYQTVHGRPLVEGTVSRSPTESFTYIYNDPFLNPLKREWVMDPSLRDVSRQLVRLARDGFRYLIIHKPKLFPGTLAQWRDYLSVPPLYESDQLVVYRTDPPHGREPALAGEWESGLGLIQIGLDAEPALSPGALVSIDARWFATQAPDKDLVVQMALAGERGELASRESFEIFPGWPTSQWSAGAVALGQYAWQISPFAPAGEYTILLDVSDTPDGPLERAISLSRVEITPLPRVFDVPETAHPLNAVFGEQMRLLGYDWKRKEDAISLVLHWQAIRRMDTSYKVFVHLYDEDTKEIVAQDDAVPRRWAYPTTWWEAGEVVSDEMPLSLTGVPAGVYALSVGVYRPGGERLPVSTGGDQVRLEGEVIVP